ncbi:hypothetical protein MRB53_025588 [Persea americana]|uniref:Uncharacterized protein n=1 Tax=Persea americana TaxID=3435 RepID=A0ACC2LGM1_PERAE|nr:hypothetical protein MRB53_025588 [Persea americana]
MTSDVGASESIPSSSPPFISSLPGANDANTDTSQVAPSVHSNPTNNVTQQHHDATCTDSAHANLLNDISSLHSTAPSNDAPSLDAASSNASSSGLPNATHSIHTPSDDLLHAAQSSHDAPSVAHNGPLAAQIAPPADHLTLGDFSANELSLSDLSSASQLTQSPAPSHQMIT